MKAKKTGHGLTRMDTDESDRQMPPGRAEKLLPDDLVGRQTTRRVERSGQINADKRLG
jgi:hypothetical protein